MKKLILLTALFSIISMGVYAQEASADSSIVFDKTTHDFGDMEVKDGPQTYSFEFTNKGSAPLIIQNVSPTCGCTTSGWTKEPVAPGDRGFVNATYTPSGTMPFDKTLMVYSNGTPATVVLHIRGKVVDTQ